MEIFYMIFKLVATITVVGIILLLCSGLVFVAAAAIADMWK